MRYSTPTTNRGYTLLFSVLTATLVLSVAVFILGVSKKQHALSVAARDSTFALYAADSGLECAIAAISGIASSTGGPIPCNDNPLDTIPVVRMPGFVDSNYKFPIPTIFENGKGTNITQGNVNILLGESSCASIIITMGWIVATNEPATVVDSRGYNFCASGGPNNENPRTVERAFRLTQLGVWR